MLIVQHFLQEFWSVLFVILYFLLYSYFEVFFYLSYWPSDHVTIFNDVFMLFFQLLRGMPPGPYNGMSSFIFGLGSVVFNLCLINRVHVYTIGETLQQKETGCRGYKFSLAATATQSSITTAFADLKYVHKLWMPQFPCSQSTDITSAQFSPAECLQTPSPFPPRGIRPSGSSSFQSQLFRYRLLGQI